MSLGLLVQLFLIVIIIGIIYNLWRISRSFGGIIGTGLRWIGLGILFFSLEALDRVLGGVGIITANFGENAEYAHNALLVLGLLFSGVGFSKLTKIGK